MVNMHGLKNYADLNRKHIGAQNPAANNTLYTQERPERVCWAAVRRRAISQEAPPSKATTLWLVSAGTSTSVPAKHGRYPNQKLQ